MIKVEEIEVAGFAHAIRGMRNPMNSWDKSDSGWVKEVPLHENEVTLTYYSIGPNDMDLMRRLFKAGTEHRKFMRMIVVWCDITAPLYWWKEFDTYRMGVEKNSCSTMHKIHAKEFEMDDFSHENLIQGDGTGVLRGVVNALNAFRDNFLKTKDKKFWWQLIQLLPSSYNQRRTVMLNYEVAVAMMKQRRGHKLDEWREFVKILNNLPYMREITEGAFND